MMNLIQNLKHTRHMAYMRYFHCLPIQSNKILLWANNFHTYGDSPKYITEYLLRNRPDRYEIVWVFESGVVIPDDLPKEVRVVRYFSIEYLKEISTAKVIICNTRIPAYCFFDKRKGQVYIQTWHSSLRLKMIEGDALSLPKTYVKNAKADSGRIDLLLSGCSFSTDIFRRAFWYDGEILQEGTPRCDLFFNNQKDIKKKVFRYYKIPIDVKFALFAPTFRDNGKAQTHGMKFADLAEMLKARDSADWIIGCRYHPNLKNAPVPAGSISMTEYPDMQELIAAADILITDYSSCMFDMAIAGKPCILYAPDISEYTTNERNLYFKWSELPFPVATDMEELRCKIEEFDLARYQSQLKLFLDAVGNCEDGHACERVAKYIERKCGLKENDDRLYSRSF